MESATLEPPGRNFPRNFPRPCKLFTRAREHCSPATGNQHTSLISTALIAKILESTEASNECETIFAAKSAMKQANLSATDSTLTHGEIPSKHSRTLHKAAHPSHSIHRKCNSTYPHSAALIPGQSIPHQIPPEAIKKLVCVPRKSRKETKLMSARVGEA